MPSMEGANDCKKLMGAVNLLGGLAGLLSMGCVKFSSTSVTIGSLLGFFFATGCWRFVLRGVARDTRRFACRQQTYVQDILEAYECGRAHFR